MVSLFPKVMISKGKDYFVLLCIVHGCPGLTEFLTRLASRFFQCFCIEHYRPVSGSLFQIIISGLQLSVYDLSDLCLVQIKSQSELQPVVNLCWFVLSCCTNRLLDLVAICVRISNWKLWVSLTILLFRFIASAWLLNNNKNNANFVIELASYCFLSSSQCPLHLLGFVEKVENLKLQ